MLAEFAHWWMSQMRALAPGVLARACLPEDALIIAFDGPAAGIEQAPVGTLLRRRQGSESGLGMLDLTHPLPAGLPPHLATCPRLPPGAVLRREVVLPLVAGRDLTAVLGYEMGLRNPSFTAPVTRTSDGKADLFSLHVTVAE